MMVQRSLIRSQETSRRLMHRGNQHGRSVHPRMCRACLSYSMCPSTLVYAVGKTWGLGRDCPLDSLSVRTSLQWRIPIHLSQGNNGVRHLVMTFWRTGIYDVVKYFSLHLICTRLWHVDKPPNTQPYPHNNERTNKISSLTELPGGSEGANFLYYLI